MYYIAHRLSLPPWYMYLGDTDVITSQIKRNSNNTIANNNY